VSNLQFYIAVVLPIVAVLASLTISLIQISGIRTDLRVHQQHTREDFRDLRKEFAQALTDLRGDMKVEFAGIREDIRALTGKVAEIDTRLSVIEERIK
jgi:Mg2+/Co2+ transporter CorB